MLLVGDICGPDGDFVSVRQGYVDFRPSLSNCVLLLVESPFTLHTAASISYYHRCNHVSVQLQILTYAPLMLLSPPALNRPKTARMISYPRVFHHMMNYDQLDYGNVCVTIAHGPISAPSPTSHRRRCQMPMLTVSSGLFGKPTVPTFILPSFLASLS